MGNISSLSLNTRNSRHHVYLKFDLIKKQITLLIEIYRIPADNSSFGMNESVIPYDIMNMNSTMNNTMNSIMTKAKQTNRVHKPHATKRRSQGFMKCEHEWMSM